MNKLVRESFKIEILLATILLIVLIFTLYTPFPLINSDSVHGFEAMNGRYWTGKWNTYLVYNTTTHSLNEKFLTWWSPGQYLAPLFFMKFFHIQLGSSVVMVNFLSCLLGTIGFFFVFKKYGFNQLTTSLSVLMILLSSTVLTSFYNYNGGECLNFMIFPWIILMQNLFAHKYGRYIFPGVILFLAFLCKSQMLIVVPPLLFLLVFIQKGDLNFMFLRKGSRRFPKFTTLVSRFFPLFISVLPVMLLIYFRFISNGDTPVHSIKQLSISPENILFPVASPLISIYFFDSIHYLLYPRIYLYDAYLLGLSILLIAGLVYVIRNFGEYEPQKKKYIFLAFMLYFICMSVFIVLYTKGTPIDINPRHLKLTSYLLYPVFLELAFTKFKKSWVLGGVILLGSYALVNHIRLNTVWTGVPRSRIPVSG